MAEIYTFMPAKSMASKERVNCMAMSAITDLKRVSKEIQQREFADHIERVSRDRIWFELQRMKSLLPKERVLKVMRELGFQFTDDTDCGVEL